MKATFNKGFANMKFLNILEWVFNISGIAVLVGGIIGVVIMLIILMLGWDLDTQFVSTFMSIFMYGILWFLISICRVICII